MLCAVRLCVCMCVYVCVYVCVCACVCVCVYVCVRARDTFSILGDISGKDTPEGKHGKSPENL